MKEAIEKLFQANTLETFSEAASTFDWIAGKETGKWHPLYYKAYAEIMIPGKTWVIKSKRH